MRLLARAATLLAGIACAQPRAALPTPPTDPKTSRGAQIACAHPDPAPPTPPTDTYTSRRAQVEADIAVLNAYRLTDATLSRFRAAARGFPFGCGLFSDSLFRRGRIGPTLDDLAGILERDTSMRRALANAGITSREFMLFTVAMLDAAVGAWVVEQRGWDSSWDDVARENVLFYQRHKPHLDSLTRRP